MRTFILNQAERDLLFLQRIDTGGEGGWQHLLVKLQTQLNIHTLEIDLDGGDLEKIPRYAFDYGNGGWEGRLKGIFDRHLGPRLGRP
jgi:hypothetical protein